MKPSIYLLNRKATDARRLFAGRKYKLGIQRVEEAQDMSLQLVREAEREYAAKLRGILDVMEGVRDAGKQAVAQRKEDMR